MQTYTDIQTPTPTPLAPPPAPPPPLTFTFVGADGKTQTLPIPRTSDEVRALKTQRAQIADQLENVSDRRAGLVRQLSTTGPDAAKSGLESRIQLLDKRILQLESDLATTGQQLSLASGALVASTEVPPPQSYDNFEEGMVVGGSMVFGFVVVVFAIRRFFGWRRRGKRPAAAPRAGDDTTLRLERLENGVDAIAIEIERVSEGQRFVTKLLSDAHLGQPAAQRVAQPAMGSGEPVKR
ncbi:MAG TPA: hypothetical protein VFK26_13870 [Gemmatimonadaceae bacterium]|nr:hypothetical protein [Gemmatimonadaceae bacterium]